VVSEGDGKKHRLPKARRANKFLRQSLLIRTLTFSKDRFAGQETSGGTQPSSFTLRQIGAKVGDGPSLGIKKKMAKPRGMVVRRKKIRKLRVGMVAGHVLKVGVVIHEKVGGRATIPGCMQVSRDGRQILSEERDRKDLEGRVCGGDWSEKRPDQGNLCLRDYSTRNVSL